MIYMIYILFIRLQAFFLAKCQFFFQALEFQVNITVTKITVSQ